MSKRAEELAEKAMQQAQEIGPRKAIVAALHEYGQEVRRRDAEIATRATAYVQFQSRDCYKMARHSAAAITREPLP